MRLTGPGIDCESLPESTGFQADLEPLIRGRKRPLSAAWISDGLLAETRRVWSREYGRPVDEEEAIEMLMNVRRLAEVLMKPYLKGDQR
jgi:hypothetical protein